MESTEQGLFSTHFVGFCFNICDKFPYCLNHLYTHFPYGNQTRKTTDGYRWFFGYFGSVDVGRRCRFDTALALDTVDDKEHNDGHGAAKDHGQDTPTLCQIAAGEPLPEAEADRTGNEGDDAGILGSKVQNVQFSRKGIYTA
ncbi:MAG: hypothetical protein IKV99_00895 [Oscillospiraceae bacterium]|nr:hypothetical protein [Oscillospiraceae bacterium]